MRYSITDGIVVRSENAALPPERASRWLLKHISGLPSNTSALDYGCGKLRYTIPLSVRVNSVVAVDSTLQLSRHQQLKGQITSVNAYVQNNLSNVRTCPWDKSGWTKRKYGFSLCANVLSAIPDIGVRLQILTTIASLLTKPGHGLVAVQYKNTYFKSYENNPNARPYLDGWLVKVRGYYSFYGIIPPESLHEHCKKAGVPFSKCSSHGETAYAVIHRP